MFIPKIPEIHSAPASVDTAASHTAASHTASVAKPKASAPSASELHQAEPTSQGVTTAAGPGERTTYHSQSQKEHAARPQAAPVKNSTVAKLESVEAQAASKASPSTFVAEKVLGKEIPTNAALRETLQKLRLTVRETQQIERAGAAESRVSSNITDAEANADINALSNKISAAVRAGDVKAVTKLELEKGAIEDAQIAAHQRLQQQVREAAYEKAQQQIATQRLIDFQKVQAGDVQKRQHAEEAHAARQAEAAAAKKHQVNALLTKKLLRGEDRGALKHSIETQCAQFDAVQRRHNHGVAHNSCSEKKLIAEEIAGVNGLVAVAA